MKREEFLKIVKLIPKDVAEEAGGTNAYLMAMYKRQTGQTDFRTFKQWSEAGRKVKPGESSFALWSRPIGKIREEKTGVPDTSETHYFGICHLFHIEQTEPTKEKR